jgi:hypothetical protein
VTVTALVLVAATAASPIFQFQTDEFWLNLHHFLYVLGRAEAKLADATRDAVRDAPGDAERGRATLSDFERRAWQEAVEFYAAGPSRKDAVFDEPLAAVTGALAKAGSATAVPREGLDGGWAAALEKAAPIYRRVWWPVHRAANQQRRTEIQVLVDRHGAEVLAFVAKAFGLQWPENGFPVHFSGYANWAGAYSTTGNLLVVSSLDRGTQGDNGLETVFHEGMHQWDDQLFAMLREQTRKIDKLVPRNLSHALIFFTAGEAVKRVIPGHVPYADAAGVWGRGMASLRDALTETWKPYLDGRGTRDEALAALVAKTATEPRR